MDGFIASKMDSNHLDNKKSSQSYQPAVGFLNKNNPNAGCFVYEY
ncbi:MAG: hypothetical protein ACXIUQ_18710 [Cecembia sp.]